MKETNGEGNQTTFLLDYSLKNSGSPENTKSCALVISNFHTSTQYQIPLNASRNVVQVEAPEGTYRIEELSCGRNAQWKLRNFHASSVIAHPQKINYLGRFSFEVSYREKTHELSLQKGDREETRKALISFARIQAPEWKERLVSAYNGKDWDPKFLEDEKYYQRGTTRRFSGKKVQLNSLDFSSCEKKEFWKNPVPLGILSYRVSYENNQFVQLEKLAEHHSFSDDYVECVEAGLKEFHPGYSGSVRYDVNL
jgi:hypothetical protein